MLKDSIVQNSLFVLTGENSTIPFSELQALINTYSNNALISKIGSRVVLVSGNINPSRITKRAAYTKIGGSYLGMSHKKSTREFREIDFSKIPESETFAVRIYNLTNEHLKSDIASDLGRFVKHSHPRLKVSLTHPDIEIWGVLIESGLHVICSEVFPSQKSWYNRRPRIRPFFHPSVLYPKFARFLVNLTQIKEDQSLLDPFCGTGSILIEASMMGMNSFGGDISRKMCIGALKNLKYFNIQKSVVINCDMSKTPFSKIDGLSTDIPYGSTASIYNKNLEMIYKELLDAIYPILKKGKYASIVHPHYLEIQSDRKFKKMQEHSIYVHRSLTRIVTLLKRI